MESKVFLVRRDLLGNNGGRSASVVFERDPDLTDVRLIVRIVLVAANDVMTARLELSEPRVHAVL